VNEIMGVGTGLYAGLRLSRAASIFCTRWIAELTIMASLLRRPA
jgi:hypothetical protein